MGDNLTGAGDGDDEQIKIDLSKIPANITKIAFTVTIYDAEARRQNFGQVSNAFVRIFNEVTGEEILRYDLGEDFSIETAVVFGELYKNGGEWKFNAIGSGYQGGAKLKKDQEKDLELVMIMAFGYPAEPLERSYEDFRRIELKKLVTIRGAFGKVQRKLLEAARLAPSAMNRQPWRFVSSEDRIHLFVKKPGKLGYQTQQDFNLFDAGVALSHMLVTAEEQRFDLEYQKLDSILEKEFQNYVYVGSLLILNDSEKI